MRRASALLLSVFLTSLVRAQNRIEPVRLCVSTLQNSSLNLIDTTGAREQLIKAFERINKSKDATKGKVARVETIQLKSNEETDPAVRENNCQFILHTDLTEVIHSGTSDIDNPRPRPVDVGSARDDPRAHGAGDNSAAIRYRIMRAGELEEWSSDVVRARDPLSDTMLVSQLMDQVANRVAIELRNPR